MVLLGIVVGNDVLLVGLGLGQLAKIQPANPQEQMGFQDQRRVVEALGQPEARLSQFPAGLVLCLP